MSSTASRDFLKCQCGGWTRADLAGAPARCSCCASLIHDQAVEQIAPANPILSRRVFQSASLRALQSSTP